MPLVDGFRRKIEYLRFSVTDHCNIRCQYCMGPDQTVREKRSEILSFDEIERMVSLLVAMGIRRVRITGGEPLVRKGVPDLVRRIHRISGIEEVLLTTNGIPLQALAGPLRDAGLEKINIHLDTLSGEKFRHLTRGGEIEKVFEGIDAAKRVGFSPIKLNAVIQRGVNDRFDEVESLLKFCADNGLILRLIEMMPIGPGRDLMSTVFVPFDEIRQKILEKYTLVAAGHSQSSAQALGGGPAFYYRVKELDTWVGFITPISQPFCDGCNRIRISSDGRFQDCLAYDGTFSFRDLLRDPQVSDGEIQSRLEKLLGLKQESHRGFEQAEGLRTPCMNGIGG